MHDVVIVINYFCIRKILFGNKRKMGKNVFLVIFRKNEGMNGDFPFSENNEC